MRSYWVSSPIATCYVGVSEKDDKIVETSAIWRKFRGQPFENLKRWLSKKGDLMIKDITGEIQKKTSCN